MRPVIARLPVGPPARSRFTPLLIVLAISGESRAIIPFARPKIYPHPGFDVRDICGRYHAFLDATFAQDIPNRFDLVGSTGRCNQALNLSAGVSMSKSNVAVR